jgi:hypothetical protein
VFIEHLFYSTAVAIIVGMVYFRWVGRDPSWIIIVCAVVPDIVSIAEKVAGIDFGAVLPFCPHTYLHTIGALLVFSLLIGIIVLPFMAFFWEGVLFAGIGYAVHLFEDALVYTQGYPFLWPITSQKLGIGLLESSRDFYGIANTEVLVMGIVLVVIAALIRTSVEGKEWIRNYIPRRIR